ncbi:MAG: alpha-galactosidase, partial [Pseudomonadota bacterium]
MSDPAGDFITLEGGASQVILEWVQTGAPLWRHWGPPMGGAGLRHRLSDLRQAPTYSLDDPPALSVLPLFGTGWFGPSAALMHRGGQDWAQAITRSTIRQQSKHELAIDLHDDIAKLVFTLRLALDPLSDVLSLSTGLTNKGDGTVDVSWLAAGTLPLPQHAQTVQSFHGRHNHEFIGEEMRLGRAGWRRENRQGLTSHEVVPAASVLGEGAGQHTGPVWSAQLAWSGNHAQSIDAGEDGGWIWQAGEWLAPGEVRLEPGETLQSPDWLATFSPDGLDGAARNFHAAQRARSPLDVAARPRPVHLNTWEGMYFNHDESDLTDLASAAARLGVERFVLDDGWFAGRDDDTSSLGDWTPDPAKYPNGLGPLAAHVTDLGMEFGLWVEPEMVNPDSDLFRAHPDWALQLAGRPLQTARNQLVLDMSRPEVEDHVYTALKVLLTDLPIRYLKWDHNRALSMAGLGGTLQGRPAYRRQVLAAYGLLDRLRRDFPDVEIEACAGGGGRIDAGLLSRTHRVWTSDCIDAVSRQQIQGGFLQFFPPDVMGAHIGAAQAHTTGRTQALGFRAAVALPGHLGLELDPRQLDPGEQGELADWIGLYKDIRGAVHSGAVWRGAAGDGVHWQAHGTPDAFLLFIYRL